MKRTSIFSLPRRGAVLLLLSGIAVLLCAGCPGQEPPPNPYSYTVTFYSNDGTGDDGIGAALAAETVESPAETVGLLPANPVRPGYIFAGWNTVKDGGGIAFTVNTPVTRDFAVYAQWGTYTYTVSFDPNGGDTPAAPTASAVTSPAATVGALPAPPTRTGWVFAGWNAAADGTGAAFTVSTAVTGNITVYAQWVLDYAYTVTFDANGGTGTNPSTKTVHAPDTTLDALPTPPARTGWVFAGWNAAADGTGAAFDASTTVTGNITVYAQWVSDYTYTVTFDANGGTGTNPPAKTVHAPDTTLDALPTPPTRAGFIFDGWNTAAEGTGTAFDASTTVSGNITVYAQWRTPQTYTVTFDANGGSGTTPPAKTVTEPDTTLDALPTSPTRAGFVFDGWNTAAEGTGAAFDASSTVSENITVYAQWVSDYTYTVTFHANGGAGVSPSTKTVHAPATTVDALPAPPTRTGFIFDGWNTDPSGVLGTPFSGSTVVSGNITVYAQWRSYTYTVTFDPNGGETPAAPPARTVTSPATTVGSLPTPPTRVGWTFAGWNTAADGTGAAFTASTTVTGNITVYARWSSAALESSQIVLRMDDPGMGAFDEPGFTLVQGGGTAEAEKTIGLAVSGDWDASPPAEWRVDGRTQPAGTSVTLNAGDYAVGGHTLQVTAYAGGRPWSKTLNFIVTAKVIGLTLNKPTLALSLGGSETLAVRSVPANATDKRVTWISGNTAVAAVSETGQVSAVGLGSAVITVTSVDDPDVSAICTVTVTGPLDITLGMDDPGAGAFDEPGFTLIQGGGPTEAAKTIGLAAPGNWDASPPAEWRVDGRIQTTGPSVTLDAGNYAVGGHVLQVTAHTGGRPWSKALNFIVTARVTGLTLNKTTLALSPGGSETLTVRPVPANATDKRVTWSSGSGTVAVVSETGQVSAVGLGSAVITVTSVDNPGVAVSCTVTVTGPLDITLGMDDPGTGAFDDPSFSLSRTGADQSKTLTLNGTWDAAPPAEWRVDGIPRGSGTVYVVNASALALGGHTLQVTAYRVGIPWSRTITFTVTN